MQTCIKEIDYGQLVAEHTSRLLSIAYGKLGDRDDAADIVQELLIHIWVKRDKLIITGSLTAYLNTALKNRILNHFSRADLHQKAVKKMMTTTRKIDSPVLDLLIEKELNTSLSEILSELPENMQKIYAMRNEDFSLREIAEALGLAEQTVKGYSVEMFRRIKLSLRQRHPDLNHPLCITLFALLIDN
ncbi:sigma-70 family RNA polymerase sigma factor [Pedobacter caeni]|uniref:RNA polymerase sigma-70 factor, ECF subfamily n=1 Tax=Pedobacter caeni TaxID=288992 RepID=A0A1M5BFR6_9SPHI|nr:sigma-70 family RNA polymerase sigma factor [Pedobacter caeni]SHF41255.1 RNA polymerase sigma-70 factor, ECF subfamily [Pedobacter caeni]